MQPLPRQKLHWVVPSRGLVLLFFSFIFPGFSLPSDCSNNNSTTTTLGINYGMVANNLPTPSETARLLQSISMTRAKIYSANSSVLRSFSNTGISFIVGIGNEDVASLTDPQRATKWVQENIVIYLPHTQISAIAVGNEVFTGDDTQLKSNLLPAMRNIQCAIASLKLDNQIAISTPHSLAVVSNSYPPSSGAFDPAMAMTYIKPLLAFLDQTGAPFMINAYPYFAYKGDPTHISLRYALFQSNPGVKDSDSGLVYYNMLDAQVDAIYSAMEALGYKNVKVIVSETGWPSAGDADEAGANVANAQAYNANLIRRLDSRHGTPLRPQIPLEAYIFALFNENLKDGPTSERHYGLFQPDGTKVYDFGLEHRASSSRFYVSASPISLPPQAILCSLVVIIVSLIMHC